MCNFLQNKFQIGLKASVCLFSHFYFILFWDVKFFHVSLARNLTKWSLYIFLLLLLNFILRFFCYSITFVYLFILLHHLSWFYLIWFDKINTRKRNLHKLIYFWYIIISYIYISLDSTIWILEKYVGKHKNCLSGEI